eukprot:SAG11_NODE_1937_length_4032_cov_6.541826_4_plen_74_part_00
MPRLAQTTYRTTPAREVVVAQALRVLPSQHIEHQNHLRVRVLGLAPSCRPFRAYNNGKGREVRDAGERERSVY